MKKLILMAVAALMATTSIKAQNPGEFYLKPMVGGTLSTLSGKYVNDAKMKFGFVGGFELGHDFSDVFGLSLGALYTMEGAKGKDNAKVKLEYINVPLLANVYLTKGLAIKAGPQIGFMTKAKGDDDINKDINLKPFCNKVDFSIPVGLSYEFSDFIIDARYNIGLSKVIKKDYTTGSVRNGVIMLTVGYKIQL